MKLSLAQEFLFFIIGGYVLLVLMLVIFQRSFMYFPDKNPVQIATAPWASEVQVKTEDGLTLTGWWSPPQPGQKTIIYFHGNAGHMGTRNWVGNFFTDQGYGYLIAGYRGYGGNPGKPTEQGFYRDARAYMNWLRNEANIPAADIVIYGVSLGSGVASQIAAEYDHAALILETPFYSAVDVAHLLYPYVPFIKTLMRDDYRNDLRVTDFKAPVLVGLAGRDSVIPPEEGQRLYDLITVPKQLEIYPEADHSDLHDFGFSQLVADFIDTLDK